MTRSSRPTEPLVFTAPAREYPQSVVRTVIAGDAAPQDVTQEMAVIPAEALADLWWSELAGLTGGR